MISGIARAIISVLFLIILTIVAGSLLGIGTTINSVEGMAKNTEMDMLLFLSLSIFVHVASCSGRIPAFGFELIQNAISSLASGMIFPSSCPASFGTEEAKEMVGISSGHIKFFKGFEPVRTAEGVSIDEKNIQKCAGCQKMGE